MSPALIRLHNVEPGELSASILTQALRTQSRLHSRSTLESSSGGGGVTVNTNTIIFIILGVVCLLVILIGFFLVSRPRVASNAGPNASSLHLPHSPITHPPRARCARDKHWNVWRIWRHTNDIDHPATADTPTSQLSPGPAITIGSRLSLTKGDGSNTDCPTTLRPSQNRRITSLSVATSFSHSHITEEALSDLRASAYDLDGDLETEMLHSAMEDAWVAHPFAVEEGCGGIILEEGSSVEAESSASRILGGGVGRDAPTQWRGGDDDNMGACASGTLDSLPTTPWRDGNCRRLDASRSVPEFDHHGVTIAISIAEDVGQESLQQAC